MTWDEYNLLIHKLQLNRAAFKPLFQCDKEILKLINFVIDKERERCEKMMEKMK